MASGVGWPTSGSPVVDMIEVSEAHPGRVLDGHRLGDHPAHRRPDDVGALDAEVVEQADGVGGHVGQRVGHRRAAARRRSAAVITAARSTSTPSSLVDRPQSRLSKRMT